MEKNYARHFCVSKIFYLLFFFLVEDYAPSQVRNVFFIFFCKLDTKLINNSRAIQRETEEKKKNGEVKNIIAQSVY